MQSRPRLGGEISLPPVLVGEVDRLLKEFRLFEGDVDLEEGEPRERRFGEQEIAAARSAANAKVVRAYVEIRQRAGDRLPRDRLLVGRETRRCAPGRVDHMAAEQHDLARRLRFVSAMDLPSFPKTVRRGDRTPAENVPP